MRDEVILNKLIHLAVDNAKLKDKLHAVANALDCSDECVVQSADAAIRDRERAFRELELARDNLERTKIQLDVAKREISDLRMPRRKRVIRKD